MRKVKYLSESQVVTNLRKMLMKVAEDIERPLIELDIKPGEGTDSGNDDFKQAGEFRLKSEKAKSIEEVMHFLVNQAWDIESASQFLVEAILGKKYPEALRIFNPKQWST